MRVIRGELVISNVGLLMSESDLQRAIIGAAHVCGYLVAHFRPAQTEQGWRTPVEGDAGFLDLVLARPGTTFLWELKGWQGVKRPQLGKVSESQVAWIAALQGGVTDARAIFPADLDIALRHSISAIGRLLKGADRDGEQSVCCVAAVAAVELQCVGSVSRAGRVGW